jgi:hypothetical protein
MYLAVWSLAATFPQCTIWPLAKKCFIDSLRPWRQKGYKRVTPPGSFIFADLTPEGSHVSSCLVPGGIIFFIVPLCPWRQHFPNVPLCPWRHYFPIVPLCPWRQKYYFNLSIRKDGPFYIQFQNFLKIQCIPL